MDRKEFLITCGYACLCGGTLLTIVEGCGTTTHIAQSSLTNNQIIINRSEFLVIKKDKKHYRKYVIVKTEKLQFPICVFRFADEEYTALLMRCTHRNCELKPEGEYLVCPCHGSEFTNKGIVSHTPAEQNLETFKTTTDNEDIYIHL
jgi:cytochrome b6-f complex iron-sulfur subunit